MNSSPAGGISRRHTESGRKFLVVVDNTPECRVALRFAAGRALHTGGGVALLYIIPKAEFQHWMAIGELMREEALLEADELLGSLVAEVRRDVGIEPEVVVHEGDRMDCILETVDEDPAIGVLVLGASVDPEGPGPLVSSFAGKLAGSLPIPVTVVPGNLTPRQIDELT